MAVTIEAVSSRISVINDNKRNKNNEWQGRRGYCILGKLSSYV